YIPAANYETPATETEARLQDIEYLSTLTNYDRAFNDQEKAAFSKHLDAMRDRVAEMSDAQFYLAIAEAVALADNGHTNVSYRPQYTQFNTIGARLYAFSDGVFIVSAIPEYAHMLGRRVVAIEGTSINELRKALGIYRGGNDAWRTLYSTLIVESPELLAAAGYAKSPNVIEMTIEMENGALETIQFEGFDLESPNDAPWRAAWRSMVPGAVTPDFSSWSHVLDADRSKVLQFLTNTSEPQSYVLDKNGLYIRALPGFSAGDQSIQEAYKAMLSNYPEGSLDYLVVDFRIHDGGDYTKSMAFAKAAPKVVKADGDVYIITGPNTFSAGIVTTAMLKYYAGDRSIIIGEQMGDREQFWAERGPWSFQLPNSGYYVNFATGYHDWEKGCKGEKFCYTMNEMYEVPAGSLSPAVSLPQDFESYVRGDDVVMNWIAEQR
ncbi:MAG: hypothetical protein MRY59_04230, partial [Aquisalinus sp.]|nr:hypothetical protein [Aquisalinus sp.]